MANLNPDARKNIRAMIADLLADISDLTQTRLAWDGKIPGVERSYGEDVCMFFDDFLGGQDLQWNVDRGLLSEDEARFLRPFYDAFRCFVDQHPKIDEKAAVITSLPEWRAVSARAQEALVSLDCQLRN